VYIVYLESASDTNSHQQYCDENCLDRCWAFENWDLQTCIQWWENPTSDDSDVKYDRVDVEGNAPLGLLEL